MPSVLAILADGFEEIETVTPIDLLRRAGISVTTAALGPELTVTGRSQIILHADTLLSRLPDMEAFDCLFLPGGPGVKTMRAHSQVQALVRSYAAANKWIAAICAAPVILRDAGLLRDKRYTAYVPMRTELPELIATERVVQDGKIITSRGAGTSLDLGLAMVEHLLSPAKAQDLAVSICC